MPHVSLITLGVSDVEQATAFYGRLGWEPSPASVPGVVTFLHGSTAALGLFGRQDLADDARVEVAQPGAPESVTLAMNVSSEGQVDEVLATARAAGADVVKEAAATEWGGYAGTFRDPDGHLWEIAHNPHFPLREDGGVALPR